MRVRTFLTTVIASAAVAGLAACSSDSTAPNTTGLELQISNDIAASSGQAAANENTDLSGADDISSATTAQLGYAPSLPHPGGAGCSQSGDVGDLRWYCVPDTLTQSNGVRSDTLIRQRNFEFFATGTPQSTITSTTDSLDLGGANGVAVYAAAHRARWRGVSVRTRHHGVTDKTPSFSSDSMRTWNGTTLAYDTASYTGSVWSATYTAVAHDTTENVVYWQPRGRYPYPQSGEFHRTVDANYTANGPSTRTGSVSRHIVVTYNGTETAQLQVIGTTTLTCSLDLATGEVSDCH